jgi:hypothetical protein
MPVSFFVNVLVTVSKGKPSQKLFVQTTDLHNRRETRFANCN